MESLRNSFGHVLQSFSNDRIHAIQVIVAHPDGKQSTHYRTVLQGDSDFPLRVFTSCQEEVLRGPLFQESLKSGDSKMVDEAVYGSIELACYKCRAFGLDFVPGDEIEPKVVSEMFGEFDRASRKSSGVRSNLSGSPIVRSQLAENILAVSASLGSSLT